MKVILNHRAETLPEALLINKETAKEILDLCIKYHESLAVTIILGHLKVQYNESSMILGSHYLGQLTAQSLNNCSHKNLFTKWQRLN